MEGGREQNYWPGFVDALSNVVLTLVFVIVIFVFALVMGANKVEQKMQEVVAAQEQIKEQQAAQKGSSAATTELEQKNKELQAKLAAAEAEIAQLRTQIPASKGHSSQGEKTDSHDQAAISETAESKGEQIDIVSNPNQKKSQGSVGLQSSGNKIVLTYPVSIAEMDDKSEASVIRALEEVKRKYGKTKVSINAIVGKEPYSAAQRYAYYRAISIRNYLISKGIADPADITNHIVQPQNPEDGRVEVIFQRP